MAFDFNNASYEELGKEYARIARESGDDGFGTKKEIGYLRGILSQGEQVLAFTPGTVDGSTWLLVLTDRRVVFLDKGFFGGLKQTSMDLDRIGSVSCKTGFMFGEINISSSGGEKQIKQVSKKSARIFVNKTQEAMGARKTPAVPVSAAPSAPSASKYDKLKQIAELKEQGILTENEFEAEKQKILSADI